MIGISLAVLSTGNGFNTIVLAKEAEVGKERYDLYFRDLIEQKLVTEKQAKACSKLLSFTERYEDLSEADIIFECIVEKIDVKHSVYKEIEDKCKNFRAIASTTSSFAAKDLAEGLKQKEKFVVAHPWNPPHLVPCVEVVKSPYTSEETVAFVKETLEAMGRKVALMNKDAPGFIGNRIQHAIIREAVHIIEQGIASPEDIDTTLQYSFMPRYTSIGLFEHQDNAGLDLVDNIEKHLFADLCNAKTTQPYIKRKVEAGELGIKTGKGIYDWNKKDLDDFRYRAQKPYFQFFNWNLPNGDE